MEERELISLIRQSDYAAFSELYGRFWKPLYTHAYKKTGCKEDAFDLTQNLFTDLWDKREKIPEMNGPLKYYLRSCIVHSLARYFRKRGFKEEHEKSFDDFLQHTPEPHAPAEAYYLREDSLDFEGLLLHIHQAIEDMPPKMREVFRLSRIEHYTISEIAAKLQLSPQTVKNQSSNALARLKKVAADLNLSPEQLLALAWLTIS